MIRCVLFTLLILATNASLVFLIPFTPARILGVTLIYCVGAAFTLYLLFNPRNQWLVANRSYVDGDRCVALTFDDGPDPIDTPRLLEILREKQVKATFFVVGARAEKYPDIVRCAWEDGHLVANHTWSHHNLFCFLTPWRLRAEIVRCKYLIEDICGSRNKYFRSPVGLRHPLLSVSLKQVNLEYISWRIRSYDTIIKSSSSLTRRILKSVASGDIILLHDHLPSGAHAMLEALPVVIDELKAKGFDFVLVGSR
jgi:peptidoglycan/xylan/chitin deacetylase (PgdA/CDA1 family)